MVVPRGKRGDYRLETVTWEVGKGREGGEGWCGRLLEVLANSPRGTAENREQICGLDVAQGGEGGRGAQAEGAERSGAEEGSQAAVVGTRSIPHLAQHSRLARCTAAQSVQIPFKVEILVFPLSSRCRSS